VKKTLRITFIIFVLLVPVMDSWAQAPSKPDTLPPGIQWMDFKEAYELNKEEPRFIFIDIYTDWCGWCKRMDGTTFQDPGIVAYFSKYFYCVKFDAERKDTIIIDGVTFVNPTPDRRRSSHKLAVEMLRGKMSYPSYVFLNKQNQLLTAVAGYQTANQLEPILHFFAEEAYLKMQWEDYAKNFQQNKILADAIGLYLL
jgi:thioredoxin-related protein